MGEQAKFKWGEQRDLENQQFREALNNTKLRETVFTEKFMDWLEKRRDLLDGRAQKLSIVSLTMSFFLLIALLSPDMSVSVLGLSEKARAFREILLFILPSVQFYTMVPSVEQGRVTEAMTLYVEKQAAGNVGVLRALKLRYGLGVRFMPTELQTRNLSKWQKVHLIIIGLSMLLWIMGIFVFLIIIEIAGIVSILRHPTFSLGASVLLCIYVLVATIAAQGMRVFAGMYSMPKVPEA
ncbi:hypothetical protein [Bradyrhizobium sp. CCGE-LA001]|uniref:hypothetical protein n=1 Tax=Bradyrhizobium sp. CCGE-LA001 TaxID=1223566 RepID=UPI0002AAD919|nr:hypothetical protein [Bradyrhizobium sp. CCGE-LA001]AMA60064.1 hypothetical protein BCCGELA001_30055 [Bradyrhizobium sp. CCGE-LA001]